MMIKVYYPKYLKKPVDVPFLINVLPCYFNDDVFRVTRDIDSPYLLLHANNAYRLSRSLAAIKGGNAFIYDDLSAEDRGRLASGQQKLLLDLGGEVFFTRPEMIEGLHDGLTEIGVGPTNVFLINSDKNAEKNYQAYCDKIGIKHRATILHFDANPFYLLAHQRKSDNDVSQAIQERKSHAVSQEGRRLFLSFNGRSRPHRLYSALYMLAHDLLDKGYVSLLDYGSVAAKGTMLRQRGAANIDKEVLSLTRQFSAWRHADECLPFAQQLIGMLPLELDLSSDESVSNRRYKSVTPWEMQNEELYAKTSFSLVTDTVTPNDDLLFVTEKVFKPCIGLHPFIYVGCHGGLMHMRDLGFQTFTPYFDESYDLEPNGNKRVVMALDELRRIALLSQEQRAEILSALAPRIEHNARHACVTAQIWVKELLEKNIIRPLSMLP